MIGSKGGGTGRRVEEGTWAGAMEGGGVSACCCLGGSEGSLMRLMTFSESC